MISVWLYCHIYLNYLRHYNKRIFMSCEIQVSTCSKCGGRGKIITDHCRRCDGSGQVQAKRTVEVVIPPGVSDGDTMQIRGEGNFDKKRLAACHYLYTLIGYSCNTWTSSLCNFFLLNIDIIILWSLGCILVGYTKSEMKL